MFIGENCLKKIIFVELLFCNTCGVVGRCVAKRLLRRLCFIHNIYNFQHVGIYHSVAIEQCSVLVHWSLRYSQEQNIVESNKKN